MKLSEFPNIKNNLNLPEEIPIKGSKYPVSYQFLILMNFSWIEKHFNIIV